MSPKASRQTGVSANPRFDSEKLLHFGEALFVASGLPAGPRPRRRRSLVGRRSPGPHHPRLRLAACYLKSLSDGTMEKHGEPEIISDHDSALTWNGRYLPGPWLVRRAITLARERLAKHPVVTVSIQQSHHIGCLQAYLKPVTDAGFSCCFPVPIPREPRRHAARRRRPAIQPRPICRRHSNQWRNPS